MSLYQRPSKRFLKKPLSKIAQLRIKKQTPRTQIKRGVKKYAVQMITRNKQPTEQANQLVLYKDINPPVNPFIGYQIENIPSIYNPFTIDFSTYIFPESLLPREYQFAELMNGDVYPDLEIIDDMYELEEQILRQQNAKFRRPTITLSSILEKKLKETDPSEFYVVWGFIDSKNGEHHHFMAKNPRMFENQIDAVVGRGSDFRDYDIYEEDFEWTTYNTQYVPKRRKIRKSKKGKGSDFLNCEQIDDEFIFCPTSEKCLLDCLYYKSGQPNAEQYKQIVSTLNRLKIYRCNIPSCSVNEFAQIMGVSVNFYRKDHKGGCLRYPYQEDQLIIMLIDTPSEDRHWIVLKDHQNLKKCYLHAIEVIEWTEKQIEDSDLICAETKVKYYKCDDLSVFNNVWVQDFEAYLDENSLFVPYASGFASVEEMYNVYKFQQMTDAEFNKQPAELVKKYRRSRANRTMQQYVVQKKGNDCAFETLKYINYETNPIMRGIKAVVDEDGEVSHTKGVPDRRDVYIYAHNSSNFDAYFYLQIEGVKCTSMIEKGGIMSMTLVHDELQNARFIIKDTFKFLSCSLKSLCKDFHIPAQYCKTELEHVKINADNYLQLEAQWKPYLDNDVISLALIWGKFIDGMRNASPEIDVKKYCTLSQLAYSIVCKEQTMTSYSNPVIRQFVQRSIRGGRVIARKQHFATQNMQALLELNNADNIDQLVGKKLHPDTLKLIGDDYQIAFDATSLYPSAMALPHATYIDPKNTYTLTEDECQNFDCREWQDKKYIIECDIFAPADLQFVPLSIKTKQGAQFSTGYLRNIVINDVDVQECLRFGYKLIKVHHGLWSLPVNHQFVNTFVNEFYARRAQAKNEKNDVMSMLYKQLLNSSYGKFGEKDAPHETKFTTEQQMETGDVYTEDVLECEKLQNGQICYKVRKERKDDQKMSSHHIASYILSYSKQIMNNFVLTLGAERENMIYYMDTDSFYIHQQHYEKLKHIKDELGGGKNDYGSTKLIIQGEYLGCKSKICYVIDTKDMTLERKVTWKGISKAKMNLIDQQVIADVISTCESKENGIYMDGIQIWKRDKRNGVGIEENQQKILSIVEYCKKYNLDNEGVYQYKHLQ